MNEQIQSEIEKVKTAQETILQLHEQLCDVLKGLKGFPQFPRTQADHTPVTRKRDEIHSLQSTVLDGLLGMHTRLDEYVGKLQAHKTLDLAEDAR